MVCRARNGLCPLLVFSTNTTLSVFGRESHIRIEKEDNSNVFRVYTVMDGNRANYPQGFETLMLPAVMVLAWQAFALFYRKRRQSINSAISTIGLFLLFQMFFLLLLTAYYTSDAARYIYDVMMDMFYIIALLIIIVDYIRFPVLKRYS